MVDSTQKDDKTMQFPSQGSLTSAAHNYALLRGLLIHHVMTLRHPRNTEKNKTHLRSDFALLCDCKYI